MSSFLKPSSIRVLIADDSIVVRRAVSDALKTDESIEVVGTAVNGEIALAMVKELKPDVLILDIEMPVCNGFEVLEAIRSKRLIVRVIMFSTLTERGAMQTIKALSLGANDYVSKPSTDSRNTNYLDQVQAIAQELIPKIKQFHKRSSISSSIPKRIKISRPVPAKAAPAYTSRSEKPHIVSIGISTGGPEALSQMLPNLSSAFPVPIVIVQHMPPLFTKLLAKRLDTISKIDVFEAEEGMSLKAGAAYLAPGDFHLVVKKKGADIVLSVNKNPPENSCRPSADVLFRSIAEVYGSRALGVIMTGMGKDGLQGLRLMRQRGAAIFAQDEASSVVWGMPSGVVHEGLADKVLPLNQLGESISQSVGMKYSIKEPSK